jgi:MSHA biogenesis protein MshM
MYRRHFGLTQAPFTLTADPAFFFALPRYREALNTLLYATHSGEGFVLITGEVGTGKTMLLSKLIEDAGPEFAIAHLPIPAQTGRGLLFDLARELGFEPEPNIDPTRLVNHIRDQLIANAEAGKRTLACVDEAQALSANTLETLRLLTNLETRQDKLLQVAVFGQPELNEQLDQHELRQLKQRITSHYRLEPINAEDIGDYLDHRLRTAGYNGQRLFTPQALMVMHLASGGIPRLLNVIAHKCLLLAYGQGKHRVEEEHARAAAEDTPGARPLPPPRRPLFAFLRSRS